MRLVPLLLSAVLSGPGTAQAARVLPWENLQAAFWLGLFEDPPTSPPPAAVQSGPLRVRIGIEGTLTVLDSTGVIRLRSGLPGRPVRVWRDGGVPVAPPWTAVPFPQAADNPLFSEAFWALEDPRRGLSGLLWVQDDGDRTLSLVHPATGKVAFFPLPEGPGLDLAFLPSGLVAAERPGPGGRLRRWILPWVALVPILARLAPPAEAPQAGTALQPFPREKGW